MGKTIDFTIFCLESYKQNHKLTGRATLKIFNEYKVFDYIESFYDVLHSTGQEYIVEDINKYIQSKQS